MNINNLKEKDIKIIIQILEKEVKQNTRKILKFAGYKNEEFKILAKNPNDEKTKRAIKENNKIMMNLSEHNEELHRIIEKLK